MLEHVTREITVEALPAEIPDNIVVDVSAMEINDTLSLATVTAPDGVTFVAEDLEEITIVTLSPPRVEEVTTEVEEEIQRVARLLLSLAKEQPDGKLLVPERMTQQDIADRVGASRDMISRIFKDLTIGGYVTVENRQITINRKPPARW